MYNKYSRHTMMTMKIFPLALALLVSMPSVAFAGYGQSGFSRQCFKEVYREEYEPGTIYSPGRVRRWTEQREVPCEGETTGYLYQEYPDPIPPTPHHHMVLAIKFKELVRGFEEEIYSLKRFVLPTSFFRELGSLVRRFQESRVSTGSFVE